jgi:hypothetical protein
LTTSDRNTKLKKVWRSGGCFGLEVDATEEVAEQKVRVAMLAVGDTHVELLEALSPIRR